MRSPPSLLKFASIRVFDTIFRHNQDELCRTLVSLRQPQENMLICLSSAIQAAMCDRSVVNCDDRNWDLLSQLYKSKQFKHFLMQLFVRVPKGCGHSLSNSHFQAFIRGLHSNVPNLKYIYLNSSPAQRLTGLSIEDREAGSIAKLTRLTNILIKGIAIKMSRFLEILQQCKHLSNVEVFDLELDVAPSSDLISDAFIHQVIIARNSKWHDLMSWCLSKSAPSDGEPAIRLQLNPYTAADLVWLRELKHVTHIYLFCDSIVEDFDTVPQFPRLTAAQVECSLNSAMVINAFLIRNGRTLERLVLNNLPLEARVTLEEIFILCPNLESLNLGLSTLYNGKKKNVKGMPVMRRLQSFSWIDSSKHTMVPLSSILSAPLLEVLKIEAREFDLSDCDQIIARIARREILLNLKIITIRRLRRLDVKKMQKLRELFIAVQSCIDQNVIESREPV